MIEPGSMPNMIFWCFCKGELFLPGMRLNKNIKIFINYFLGPALFIWLLFSIYQQVRYQPHLETSYHQISGAFTSSRSLYLLGIFGLMLVNWGLEAAKWRLSVNLVHPVSFWQSFKAVLSGVSFSVTMPNRVGDYLGRILYLPDGKRLKVISLTVISSISQLLITLLAGTVGCLLLKRQLISGGILNPITFQFAVFGLEVGLLILTLFYFNLGIIQITLEKWFRSSSYLYLIDSIRSFGMQRLIRLLLLSGARYAVFISQYILAFRLFGVDVSLLNAVWIMSLVFLALAVIPSIVLLEVGIRGQVSLQLVGLFTANSLGILLTSVTIWAINLMIPAIVGSILILGIKVFKRQ
ncbi:MAG: hypothetical protein JWP69_1275 [Flaviaesturariibacter sp.]|nr:hypothetical protein [Flaviaesturariibacter sp.]